MAKKRLVDTKFWEDNYSSNLDPIEKLMFLYFLTNSHTSICGIYQVPLKIIAVDTGIDRDMVLKILSRFERDWKLIFREGWIAIKNFIRYQNEWSPKIKAWIEKELLWVPKELKVWALWSQEEEKIQESWKGIDTLSHSNRDSNSNSNSNLNRDSEKQQISEENFSPTENVPIPEDSKVPLAVREKSEYELSMDFLKKISEHIFDPVIETPDFAVWHEKEWRAFLAHFIEKDKSGKMKAEREKTFSIKLRFLKWLSNWYGSKQNSHITY